jgi:hypothetical protein
MQILPPITNLPPTPVERRHNPQGAADYGQYRQCLRWDFGFTCAFCLLHEADLVEHGAEGSALTWVEHRIPQSEDSSQANTYDNCFYSCRYCNRSRSVQAGMEWHRRTARPCEAWGAHFQLVNDKVVPKRGDHNAAYTEKAYSINVGRKVATRRHRREVEPRRARCSCSAKDCGAVARRAAHRIRRRAQGRPRPVGRRRQRAGRRDGSASPGLPGALAPRVRRRSLHEHVRPAGPNARIPVAPSVQGVPNLRDSEGGHTWSVT